MPSRCSSGPLQFRTPAVRTPAVPTLLGAKTSSSREFVVIIGAVEPGDQGRRRWSASNAGVEIQWVWVWVTQGVCGQSFPVHTDVTSRFGVVHFGWVLLGPFGPVVHSDPQGLGTTVRGGVRRAQRACGIPQECGKPGERWGKVGTTRGKPGPGDGSAVDSGTVVARQRELRMRPVSSVTWL